MSKIILFIMISLDGFYEDRNNAIDWHHRDAEFDDFSMAQTALARFLLFGRKTYTQMAGFWNSADSLERFPGMAKMMKDKNKIVCSRTLKQTVWSNTQLVSSRATEAIAALKQQAGDTLILGSSGLAASLMHAGLIDEFRFMINPVILGKGVPLFHSLSEYVALQLIKTKVFGNGNVLQYYHRAPVF